MPMKDEIKLAGGEFHAAAELYPAQESDHITAPEITPPPEEYPPLPNEYSSEPTSENEEDSSSSREKRKKKINAHKKLSHLMSYAVASCVAVLMLAHTLYSQDIIDNVIAAGGNVDGDLRFSIQWNDTEVNLNDFDAHCIEPNGYELYYSNRGLITPCGGDLDVDIIDPGELIAIENIYYADKKDMEDGTYELSVVCFSNNGYSGGFRAQIEIDNIIYNFTYDKPMETGERVVIAEVTLSNGRFSIDKKIGRNYFWEQ